MPDTPAAKSKSRLAEDIHRKEPLLRFDWWAPSRGCRSEQVERLSTWKRSESVGHPATEHGHIGHGLAGCVIRLGKMRQVDLRILPRSLANRFCQSAAVVVR